MSSKQNPCLLHFPVTYLRHCPKKFRSPVDGASASSVNRRHPPVANYIFKSFMYWFPGAMAGKAVKSVAKAVGEHKYPWQEKLVKYKDELSKGVWGYWELGAWKPLGISARHRARLRKEVVLAGQDWPYDPERKEMKTKQKGHKCDRISAEKRAKTAELMQKMPEMLADYRKRRWERKMKAEEDASRKAVQE
ncbi:hypothetical protein RND71_021674 [Anisodus tanguticus]|uniref:Uncharacterized protein n=1 Tax=Anisodus tanguticus TaxID=243964 RepID=A0AAE1RXF3_9SOLA|nr:hypothetical protein RND71_021674 [Anisodus tanguticus]